MLDQLKEMFLSMKIPDDLSLAMGIRQDEEGLFIEILAGDHDRFVIRGERAKELAHKLIDLVPEGIKEVMPMPEV